MLATLERRDFGAGPWFASEVMDILGAVDGANLDIAAVIQTPEMALYRRGFEAAIGAVAQAFGLWYYKPSTHTERR